MHAVAVAVSATLIAGNVAAQISYFEKPIRIVVGFPPGSTSDLVARLVGQKFTEAWGKPVVIDNVTGAAGNIAAERVAKAVADGYTLLLAAQTSIVVNPSLYRLSYDPEKDFAPVSQVAVSPNMLVVHNAVPAKSVHELIELARAQPGELTFASGGSGSSPHLAGELLKSVAGLDIRHIPYKGVAAATPDLLGGRVMMMFSPISIVLPLARDGKLRALAVTSLKRSPAAPELPTIAESGYPGFEVTVWHGLLAPAGTPSAIITKLNLETVRMLALIEVRTKLGDLGLEIVGNSPEEFAVAIKSEVSKWAKVIRNSGIKRGE
jgi:tripartite-type tricarboxylate transporter receptor subunit TctC